MQFCKCSKLVWERFKKYHYLTAQMNNSAQCFCLKIKDTPVAFCGIIHFPHPHNDKIKKISRLVVLPDYQGFGFSQILANLCGEYYKGFDFRISSSNPSIISSFSKSKTWKCTAQGHVAYAPKSSKISHNNTCKKILTTFKYIFEKK